MGGRGGRTFLNHLSALGLPGEALDQMLSDVVKPVGTVRLMGRVAVETLDGHTCNQGQVDAHY